LRGFSHAVDAVNYAGLARMYPQGGQEFAQPVIQKMHTVNKKVKPGTLLLLFH
jgi:hypothetical protein